MARPLVIFSSCVICFRFGCCVHDEAIQVEALWAGPIVTRARLENTLESVSKMFQSAHIKFFIEGGTALALHRDSALQDDDDVDMVVSYRDDARLRDLLADNAMTITFNSSWMVRCDLGPNNDTSYGPIDIYFDYTPDLDVTCYQSIGMKRDLVEPTGSFTFRGLELPVPRQGDKFMHLLYGDDWRTPKDVKVAHRDETKALFQARCCHRIEWCKAEMSRKLKSKSKSKSTVVLVMANSVLIVAVVAGLGYMLVGFRRGAGNSPQPSMLSTLCGLGPLVLLSYWFFSVGHTFFQHMAANVKLSPVVPTVLIYILKLGLALIMYRCTDGTFVELFHSVRRVKRAVLWYILPAACLAFYDVLSFISLARLSPAQYQILLHLRTVFVAVVWQVVMSKRLTGTQWALLISCIYATMLTERTALLALTDSTMIATTLAPYAALGVQFVLSVVGNVSNESFLKEVDLTVNAQNIVLYTFGTLILTVALLVDKFVREPVENVHELSKILEASVLMSILTLSLLGVTSAFVLKLWGNIWKELAGVMVTFTTAGMDWFVMKNRQIDLIDYQAVAIVAISLGVYSLLETKMSVRSCPDP